MTRETYPAIVALVWWSPLLTCTGIYSSKYKPRLKSLRVHAGSLDLGRDFADLTNEVSDWHNCDLQNCESTFQIPEPRFERQLLGTHRFGGFAQYYFCQSHFVLQGQSERIDKVLAKRKAVQIEDMEGELPSVTSFRDNSVKNSWNCTRMGFICWSISIENRDRRLESIWELFEFVAVIFTRSPLMTISRSARYCIEMIGTVPFKNATAHSMQDASKIGYSYWRPCNKRSQVEWWTCFERRWKQSVQEKVFSTRTEWSREPTSLNQKFG